MELAEGSASPRPESSPPQPNDYRVLPADEAGASMLASACGVSPTAAQVLLNRGVREAEDARDHLEATLRGLSSPDAMADRAEAADRLAHAIRTRERIAVFGDYDVDGTTSALILTEIITALGGQATTHIADRFLGGYGLSGPGLDRCLADRPQVIVTCDCGSSDHARIERAAQAGVDVVVVDHHLVPEQSLPAFAFLNPHRPECGFDDKGLCSAGLAFSLGAALRTTLGAKIDIRPWLDLVAIGTVADLAPLTGDNRRLVRAGLQRLGSTTTRPALRALRKVAKLPDSEWITARDVAFRLAPRLNAPGRLGHADLTLRLLEASSMAAAMRLVQEVEQQNDERKRLATEATEDAKSQVRELYGPTPSHGVVVASASWHRGVAGIAAARLVDAFGVPAVVVAFDGDLGHGSARTLGGFDVHRAVARGADALESWGGHRAAAGLSLRSERLETFRAAFADATTELDPSSGEAGPIDVELGGMFRVPTLDDLHRLGPFGEGHPAPRFLAHARVCEATGVGEGKAHAKLRLQIGDDTVRAFAPGLHSRIEGRETISVVGEFQPDHWIGGQAIELLVTDVLD